MSDPAVLIYNDIAEVLDPDDPDGPEPPNSSSMALTKTRVTDRRTEVTCFFCGNV